MKAQQLEKLKKEILDCQACPLFRNRTKPVFGAGNPDSPIMLIGEAPGMDEDKTGEPFVGRAGQLLDKILLACNFTRDKHVFIGNIIKCRPPQNRKPETSEMATCLHFLEEQINIINPSIIVAMGSIALKGLLGGNPKITSERGKWQVWMNRYLMPTFHPADLLRNPNLKRNTWEDFKKVITKYREIVDKNHSCQYV